MVSMSFYVCNMYMSFLLAQVKLDANTVNDSHDTVKFICLFKAKLPENYITGKHIHLLCIPHKLLTGDIKVASLMECH